MTVSQFLFNKKNPSEMTMSLVSFLKGSFLYPQIKNRALY